MHIDFTYILGSKPPLDAPPISLASEMVDAFERVGCWDDFVKLCGLSFVSARANSTSILRVSRHAFARCGLKESAISRFLRSQKSLYLSADDEVAREYVEEQVRNGASNAQTWIKRIAHDVIDPAWYGLLKKGFPPAVAVMSWLDNAENAEANALAQQLKEIGDQIAAEDRVEVDE